MRAIRVFSIAMLALLPGCGSARYVLKEQDRGIVAISHNSEKNREKAEELMARHFPGGYVIEREEEVVVGETTTQSARSNDRVRGDQDKPVITKASHSSSSTTTTDLTEWRISYRRAPSSTSATSGD